MAVVIVMPLLAGCGVSKADYDQAKEDLTACQEAKTQMETENTALNDKIADLEKATTVAPSPQDPSYSALMSFVVRDYTDSLTLPGAGVYGTVFFARAREAGIKSYLTRITIPGPPQQYWYFTGFNTTDRGLIYILPCPGFDGPVILEVGKKYHELNGFSSFGVDDTILKIELFE